MSKPRLIRIGVAGWSYADWKGIVYPVHQAPHFDPLSYLVDFYDTIEVNSTFYRPAHRGMTTSWARRSEANPHFRFTVKLHKSFTHDRSASSSDEKAVKDGLVPLIEAGKLGAMLLQFPWSFKNDSDSRNYLEHLTDRFADYPLVTEVRHSSWNQPEFYEYLTNKHIGFCNIDQPRIGRSIGPSQKATGPVGYVRLHGRNYQDWFREDAGRDARYDYLYNESELDPWMDKILQIAEESAETYVITNNHFQGKAAVNALQIKAKLTSSKVGAPASLVASYPFLKEVAEANAPPSKQDAQNNQDALESQGRLFD